VVKNEDGTFSRGYKLATLRTLLDRAGLLSQVALSAIQGHEMAVGRPLLEQAPVLRAGDLLLEERGCIDGVTLAQVQRKRRVDVIMPLKANMLATKEARHLAALANEWPAHPSRAEPTIALVRGLEHMGAECDVPLNACVSRFWNTKNKRTAHSVLVTTDLQLSAPWIVRHYEARPEIEQDYQQMKRCLQVPHLPLALGTAACLAARVYAKVIGIPSSHAKYPLGSGAVSLRGYFAWSGI
jgi:hypothetical protein